MIYPDDFSNSTVYRYREHYYAICENTWYRLWGWLPYGGREATAVTDVGLIDRLDSEAEEHPPNGAGN